MLLFLGGFFASFLCVCGGGGGGGGSAKDINCDNYVYSWNGIGSLIFTLFFFLLLRSVFRLFLLLMLLFFNFIFCFDFVCCFYMHHSAQAGSVLLVFTALEMSVPFDISLGH